MPDDKSTSSWSKTNPDVLLEIFSYFFDEPINLPLPQNIPPPSAWALRQVCSQWRAVSLTCSSFWRYVRVNSPPIPPPKDRSKSPSPKEAGTVLSRWNHALQAAGKLLPERGLIKLSLHIFALSSQTEHEMAESALLVVISPNESRLQSLELDCSLRAYNALTQNTRRYKALETLVLRRSMKPGDKLVYRAADETDRSISHHEFDNFANIQTLHLCDISAMLPSLAGATSLCSRLINLTISEENDDGINQLTFQDIFPVLAKCTDLRRLTIKGAHLDDDADMPERVELPHLQSLEMKFVHIISELEVLPLMAFTKALTELRLSSANTPRSFIKEAIKLIDESQCSQSLTTVILSTENPQGQIPRIKHDELRDLATRLPCVKELRLTLMLVSDDILFLSDLARNGCFPKIETVGFFAESESSASLIEQVKGNILPLEQDGSWQHLREVFIHIRVPNSGSGSNASTQLIHNVGKIRVVFLPPN